MFNEIKIIVIMYHMMFFSDVLQDPEEQYKLGYSCLVLLILGTSVNFIQLVYAPIKKLRRWCYIKKSYRKVKKVMETRGKKVAKEFQTRRLKDKVNSR